jgi:hypothetical protein
MEQQQEAAQPAAANKQPVKRAKTDYNRLTDRPTDFRFLAGEHLQNNQKNSLYCSTKSAENSGALAAARNWLC